MGSFLIQQDEDISKRKFQKVMHDDFEKIKIDLNKSKLKYEIEDLQLTKLGSIARIEIGRQGNMWKLECTS